MGPFILLMGVGTVSGDMGSGSAASLLLLRKPAADLLAIRGVVRNYSLKRVFMARAII